MHFVQFCLSTLDSFFFFQAEGGIRDHCVTGVQSCALPICIALSFNYRQRHASELEAAKAIARDYGIRHQIVRSEERRVGKECRYRWSRYH